MNEFRTIKITVVDFDGKEYEISLDVRRKDLEDLPELPKVQLHFLFEGATKHMLSLPLCTSFKEGL